MLEIMQPKIYTASKTKHASKWVELRKRGVKIISTWIDEAEEGASPDMYDLQQRCIQESMTCDAMIVYAEQGDYLKGAFIEMGVALAANKPVYLVGEVLPIGSAFTHSDLVKVADNVDTALSLIDMRYRK